MSHLNRHKLREWVWSWQRTFKLL